MNVQRQPKLLSIIVGCGDEKGMILIVVLALIAILTLAGTTAVITTTTDIKISGNYKTSVQSFYTAEAGIERANNILKSSTNGFDDELLGSDGIQNTPDDGILSFGSAVSFGNGTYTVRINDNNDGDGNLFHDSDNIVVITGTGTIRNAAHTIEKVIEKIQIPMNVDGALSIYGNDPEVEIKGNSEIHGDNYDVPFDFNCSGAGCDGTPNGGTSTAGIYFSTTPDAGDIADIETSGPQQNVFGNPPTKVAGGSYTNQYWQNLTNKLIPLANVTLSGGTISGNQTLGTRSNPQITVITNGVDFTGSVDGAGILIVQDEVEFEVKFSGNLHFEGIIIVLSNGINAEVELDLGAGGTPRLFGALVLAGSGESEVELKGNSRILYSTQALMNVNNINSLSRIIAKREITN
ncbi:MAG: pilus assembly PilX N-terminal domain-containing protein [Candidatus Brocadiaceae bacterium]|nr:pilus assembly PilX N-terminal domain-containing protein [Candidatus Brocadiaceae bacterium]